ncbi:MAG: clostripain-related cysteine peptidase [Caldilineaceae bacterium]
MQLSTLSIAQQGRRSGLSVSSWLIAVVGLCCLLATFQRNAAGKAPDANVPIPAAGVSAVAAAQIAPQPTDAICTELSGVSQRECNALLALYLSTDGGQWENRANWLRRASAASPCDWAGVRCAGGHVTQLLLAGNGLHGRLPRLVGSFPFLTHLLLANNQLAGPVPPEICDLVDSVQVATLGYNQIYADSEQVTQCLRRLQPDWVTTQTMAPRAVRVTTIATDTLALAWEPIPYSGDAGYYEISYYPVITSGVAVSYTVHGITADKHAAAYTLDGLIPGQNYRIRVRTYTPAHVAQENDQWSGYTYSAATTRMNGDPVLVLIYFPADNDLSPYIASVVRRVQLGTRANPNVQVVMLVDARGDHNTVVMTIANGELTRTNAVQEAWGTDELDSTDPAVLTWFLQSARARYPASRTVVSLMGHGSGMTPEVDGEIFDEELPMGDDDTGIPALPKTIPATPGDYENGGGYLSTADFAQALAAATDNGDNPFDVVFFDQCFQGSLDVLYEFHSYARVFVASPNYAWLAAPYHRYLVDFIPTATPEALAEAIIVHYQAALTDAQPNVIFWVRGADIPPIADAVSTLGDTLQNAVAAGAEAAVTQAALRSQYVDTTQCGRGNLALGQPDELVGAGSFARNLLRSFDSDTHGVQSGRSPACPVGQGTQSGAHRSTLYCPRSLLELRRHLHHSRPLARRDMSYREMVQANVWRASIYHDQAPLAAVLAGNPSQAAMVTTVFNFAQNGRWDDFIAHWYTTPLTPTIGTRCSYMPPAIVRGTITETLALTVSEQHDPQSGDTITIDWTSATATAAESYWLLVRPAGTIRWQVLDRVPLTQTTYLLQKPEPGIAYEFIIVAQDELGTTVSESDQVRYAAAEEARDRQLFLPVVRK